MKPQTLITVGGLLLMVGAAMPWAKVTSDFLGISRSITGLQFRSPAGNASRWIHPSTILMYSLSRHEESNMYQHTYNPLFSNAFLYNALEAHIRKAEQKVNDIPRQQFLASSDDLIFEHVKADLFVNALVLYEDAMTMKDEEIQIETKSLYIDTLVRLSGIRVTFSIPYTGDSSLWTLCPSSSSSVVPHGIVRSSRGENDGILEFVIEQATSEPQEQIKSQLERNLGLLREYLANQKANIDMANAKLDPLIRDAIRQRREKLGKHDEIVRMLGIPLERRDGVPNLKPIVLEKKIVKPLLSVPKEVIEYGIKDADYEHILAVIRHEGATFESTPKTYRDMGETDLRNILLAHLNGHYKGSATGETFRGEGKTDIRIEFENRAAFVAECKIWRGPKELTEAVDQMLGYLTWRDCKCALVVFNKENAGFVEIQDKIPSLMKNHENFQKEMSNQSSGEWRFVLTSKDDKARYITVQVFIFNLYCK